MPRRFLSVASATQTAHSKGPGPPRSPRRCRAAGSSRRCYASGPQPASGAPHLKGSTLLGGSTGDEHDLPGGSRPDATKPGLRGRWASTWAATAAFSSHGPPLCL